MKITSEDLQKLREALENNQKWDKPSADPGQMVRQERAKGAHNQLPGKEVGPRPSPFDEPGEYLQERLEGVGLGFDGLKPVFMVRQGLFINIDHIEDELMLNASEAKYKVATAGGRYIIAKLGRTWYLEKKLG